MNLRVRLDRLLIRYEQFQPFKRKRIVINNLIGLSFLPFIIFWTRFFITCFEDFDGGEIVSALVLFLYFLGMFIYAILLPKFLFYFERPMLNFVSYITFFIIYIGVVYFYRDFSMPIPLFFLGVPLLTFYYSSMRYGHLTKIKKFFLY